MGIVCDDFGIPWALGVHGPALKITQYHSYCMPGVCTMAIACQVCVPWLLHARCAYRGNYSCISGFRNHGEHTRLQFGKFKFDQMLCVRPCQVYSRVSGGQKIDGATVSISSDADGKTASWSSLTNGAKAVYNLSTSSVWGTAACSTCPEAKWETCECAARPGGADQCCVHAIKRRCMSPTDTGCVLLPKKEDAPETPETQETPPFYTMWRNGISTMFSILKFYITPLFFSKWRKTWIRDVFWQFYIAPLFFRMA